MTRISRIAMIHNNKTQRTTRIEMIIRTIEQNHLLQQRHHQLQLWATHCCHSSVTQDQKLSSSPDAHRMIVIPKLPHVELVAEELEVPEELEETELELLEEPSCVLLLLELEELDEQAGTVKPTGAVGGQPVEIIAPPAKTETV